MIRKDASNLEDDQVLIREEDLSELRGRFATKASVYARNHTNIEEKWRK